jgi:hypothetical protein
MRGIGLPEEKTCVFAPNWTIVRGTWLPDG